MDEGITDTAKYKEYENADGTAMFSVQEWAFETEYSKGFYINKEYVSVVKNVELTDTIKDRMDTVKIMKFVGPIVWLLVNVLIFMPRFDIQVLHNIDNFLTWPYIVGGNIILGIIVVFLLFKR